ncbi:PadR family transcriptional regulator [Neobacillus mesonae]|nr:PadR family transcriptional regulator [Neobacillus mesonae]
MRFYDEHTKRGHHPHRKGFSNEHRYPEAFVKHRHGGSRGGHGGGRGEGGHRFFGRGEFKFALLELLVLEPMHGYQLIKAMEEKTGGLYVPSAGSVYPNLQLLEDMKFIGSTEADGKKLYHVTEEGLTALAERRNKDPKHPGEHWEHRGRHRHPDGENGKRNLRGLMKDWPEVIYLMAQAAKEVKERPDSAQSAQIKEMMEEFQNRLQGVLNPDVKDMENKGD